MTAVIPTNAVAPKPKRYIVRDAQTGEVIGHAGVEPRRTGRHLNALPEGGDTMSASGDQEQAALRLHEIDERVRSLVGPKGDTGLPWPDEPEDPEDPETWKGLTEPARALLADLLADAHFWSVEMAEAGDNSMYRLAAESRRDILRLMASRLPDKLRDIERAARR